MTDNVIDITDTLRDMNCGIFTDKLSRALRDVAHGVIANGKQGKVTIQLDLKQVGQGQQVNVSHKLSYAKPTKRGKQTEEDTTETAFYVGRQGLTLLPDNQLAFNFEHKEEPAQ